MCCYNNNTVKARTAKLSKGVGVGVWGGHRTMRAGRPEVQNAEVNEKSPYDFNTFWIRSKKKVSELCCVSAVES